MTERERRAGYHNNSPRAHSYQLVLYSVCVCTATHCHIVVVVATVVVMVVVVVGALFYYKPDVRTERQRVSHHLQQSHTHVSVVVVVVYYGKGTAPALPFRNDYVCVLSCLPYLVVVWSVKQLLLGIVVQWAGWRAEGFRAA